MPTGGDSETTMRLSSLKQDSELTYNRQSQRSAEKEGTHRKCNIKK